MTTVSAIIVAAGKGRRMNAAAPKQYLVLGGLPILSRTLLAVDACPEVDDICLVVPGSDIDYCRKAVLDPICLRAPVKMIAGGAQRQESVYNGLSSLASDDHIVLIHDGVRPFVGIDEIRRCIDAAKIHGACIPGLPVIDTLKAVDDGGDIIRTIDRSRLWHAQTPQAFQCRLIKDAHEKAKRDGITGTDDALLIERLGEKVHVVSGSIFNIKITTPEDLKMAEAIADAYFKSINSALKKGGQYMTDLMDVIRERRSIRNYEPTEIPRDKIHAILEAVQMTPSWANTQCWEVIVVTNPEIKQQLQEAVPKSNPAYKSITAAPVVLALCAKKGTSGYYKDIVTTQYGDWFMFDLGLAAQSIGLAAHFLGLGSLIIGLYDHVRAKEVLGVPEGIDQVALITLGYPSKVPSPPKRRDISEFTHENRF